MTTTAEKIEQLRRDFERLRIKIDELERMQAEEPDPEPLECWVNVLEGGVLVIHKSLEDAVKPNYGGPTRKRSGIYLREVTPQDEQDRKDAARYRHLKQMGYRSLHGYIAADWDELIDKAMEES